MKLAYWVEIKLYTGDIWVNVATCENAEVVNEVVRILLTAWGSNPNQVRVTIVPVD